MYGAPGRIRTRDLRLRRPLLYPTELQAQKQKWSGKPDSTPQPPAWKASALPLSYFRPSVLPIWSGRKDSNLRPPAPKAGALTRLRYAPIFYTSFVNSATTFPGGAGGIRTPGLFRAKEARSLCATAPLRTDGDHFSYLKRTCQA